MTLTFWKTTCLGNTFLHILEEGGSPVQEPEALARLLCDPELGAGADGITLTPVQDKPRIGFAIINRDGSRAEISGNGMAGAASVRFFADPSLQSVLFQTAAGERTIRLLDRTGAASFRLSVDLGVPRISPPPPHQEHDPLFLSVGNPQAVFRVSDPAHLPAPQEQDRIHKQLVQTHKLTRGINLAWCAPIAPGRAAARFWERGAGPTPASGTGAAAVHTALKHWGLAEGHLCVVSPGGQVNTWFEKDRITLENHCSVLYKGSWLSTCTDTILPSHEA